MNYVEQCKQSYPLNWSSARAAIHILMIWVDSRLGTEFFELVSKNLIFLLWNEEFRLICEKGSLKMFLQQQLQDTHECHVNIKFLY